MAGIHRDFLRYRKIDDGGEEGAFCGGLRYIGLLAFASVLTDSSRSLEFCMLISEQR